MAEAGSFLGSVTPSGHRFLAQLIEIQMSSGTNLKASSLLASFLGAGRYYVHYWEREVFMNLTQL